MNTTIPPALAPYIRQCLTTQSLTFLTSVLDTPANWLLVRIFVAHLQEQYAAKSSHNESASQSRSVILVSIWRSFDLWADLARKVGTNLQQQMSASKACYIDGLAASQATPAQSRPNHLNLKRLSLGDLDAAVAQACKILTTSTPNSTPLLLIDGLDFLLAMSQAPAMDVQSLLLKWQSQLPSLVVTCSADSALLHNADAAATALELNHTILARCLAHQAQWIFQLRPLETGHSKEVSGSVRVSRCGIWEEGGPALGDAEWLYHLNGAGSVRVWSRGET